MQAQRRPLLLGRSRQPTNAAAVAVTLSSLVVAIAIVLSFLPNEFDWGRTGEEVDAAGGSLIRQLQWFPLFASAGLVVWWRRIESSRLLRYGNNYLWLFVVWASATVLWSPYPEITFRKLWSLYGVVLLAMCFVVAGWTPERFARVLRNVFAVLMVASVLLILLLPEIGVHQEGSHTGHWRGVCKNKNHFGGLATLSLMAWSHAWLSGSAPRRQAIGWTALALLLLSGAGSATAMVTALVVVTIMVVLLRPPMGGYKLLIGGALLVGIVTLAGAVVLFAGGDAITLTPVLEAIAGLFGRDLTLTGRDQIWELVLAEFRDHWLLGYGYNTFWLGEMGPSGRIAEEINNIYWQAHNGYIDLLNETGLIGGLIVAGFFFNHFLAIARLSLFDKNAAVLHLALATLVLVHNMAESSLFRGLSIYWILLALSSTVVSHALLEARFTTRSDRGFSRTEKDRINNEPAPRRVPTGE